MSKGIKTFLKVTGLLVFMDFTDIAAKGHILYWMDVAHPEAAKDFRDHSNLPKISQIRGTMINKIADYLKWAFEQLEE